MPEGDLATATEESVLLRAADDQPSDDVDDFHRWVNAILEERGWRSGNGDAEIRNQ